MYNLEKDAFFLCWISFWLNVMVHFHVVVLHDFKPRTVAEVSTLKKARSIAKSLLYEHLFKEVMIWRYEFKFVEIHRCCSSLSSSSCLPHTLADVARSFSDFEASGFEDNLSF